MIGAMENCSRSISRQLGLTISGHWSKGESKILPGVEMLQPLWPFQITFVICS